MPQDPKVGVAMGVIQLFGAILDQTKTDDFVSRFEGEVFDSLGNTVIAACQYLIDTFDKPNTGLVIPDIQIKA